MAPREQRRRSIAGVALTLGVSVAVATSALSFVGQASRSPALRASAAAGPSPTALEAQKDKQKQRLSLSEALDREKERKMKEAAGEIDKKDLSKLSPEQTFWEGPPSSTECFIPFLASFLVLGIIPFIAAANRQFKVKYKITDRRVSVTGGLDGKDITEFSYQEIKTMEYQLRWFGYCADMRIDLRDGAKVEMFGLLNFEDNYEYILSRVEKDAKNRSTRAPRDLKGVQLW